MPLGPPARLRDGTPDALARSFFGMNRAGRRHQVSRFGRCPVTKHQPAAAYPGEDVPRPYDRVTFLGRMSGQVDRYRLTASVLSGGSNPTTISGEGHASGPPGPAKPLHAGHARRARDHLPPEHDEP